MSDVARRNTLVTETDRAIREVNDAFMRAFEAAGPGACPNCLKQGGGYCWCCTDDEHPPRDRAAWSAANGGVPWEARECHGC